VWPVGVRPCISSLFSGAVDGPRTQVSGGTSAQSVVRRVDAPGLRSARAGGAVSAWSSSAGGASSNHYVDAMSRSMVNVPGGAADSFTVRQISGTSLQISAADQYVQ
jgi:hypothetical protein